jgi:hypothetical protein
MTMLQLVKGCRRLSIIDEARARSDSNEERLCVTELLRIKDELIPREGAPQPAQRWRPSKNSCNHPIEYAASGPCHRSCEHPQTFRACSMTRGGPPRRADFRNRYECGNEQRSYKRRLVDQSNSRSRSSRGIPSKRCYHCSGPPVLDTSSQVGFMRALTYQLCPASAPLGRKQRLAASYLWHAYDEADEGRPDLPQTGNLRAVQLLLGHTKLESTVRYLGIEVDDTLNISEQIEL